MSITRRKDHVLTASTQQWVVPSPLPSNPVDNAPTIAKFEQALAGISSSFNFAGRTITETYPDGSGDTCHFARSAYSAFVPTPAQPFVMDIQDSNQHADDVGSDAEVINYYRYYQRAPCDLTTTQVMTISCSSGDKPYATFPMDIQIGTSTLTSTKQQNPQNASQSQTWGETQAQYEKGKTAGVMVSDWLFVHGL